MPAGQKISQRGALLDESTGLMVVNQQPTGGVWSLMVDGSAIPPEPVRRMRQSPQQAPRLDDEERRLVEKMKWNPQAENLKSEKRDLIAQKWANTPSAMPGHDQSQETVRSRRPVDNGGHSNSSISLGWNEAPRQEAPPPMSERSSAPWMQEETGTSRLSRRSVGGDHNKSK